MKSELLIISHAKDFPWLEWCLKSIKKFVTGFRAITVLVPLRDQGACISLLQDYHNLIGMKSWIDPEPRELRFMSHMVQKCFGDFWCPGADVIFHIDSDCLFTGPVTPEHYFDSGKPVLWCRPCEGTGGYNCWKKEADAALQMDTRWDTTCGHPFIYTRDTYRAVRERVSKIHRKPFERYVLGCKNTHPQGFCEFNSLGNMALETPRLRDQYRIRNVAVEGWPEIKLSQFWSWGGLEKALPEIHRILG